MRRGRGRIIGAALAALAMAAACAPGSEPEQAGNGSPSGQLTYVYFTDGPDEQVTRSLIGEFERQHGVRVELQILPFSELEQQLQGRLASGNAPDVVRLHNLTPFRGDLLDLAAHGQDIGDQFLAEAQSYMEGPDGGTVALPSDLTMNGPLVNTDLFREAGVPLPARDKPWTWTELAGKAKQVQQATDADYAIAFDKSGHRLAGMFSQFGTTYFGTGGGVRFDQGAATRALQLFVDLHRDGAMYRDFWVASGTKYEGANDLFLRQDVPVYFSGNWQVSQFAEEAKFGWAVMPNPCEQRCGGFPGGKFMAALKQSANPELAATFVAFMNSKAAQERYAKESAFLPTRKDLIEQGVRYPERDADMDTFLADVKRTEPDTYASAYHPGFDATADAVVKESAAAIAGQQSVSDSVARIRTAAQEALEAARR